MKKRLKVLITCGGTQEPLDPVRFISNRASGTLGAELAHCYSKMGHGVTLVHGQMPLSNELKVKKIPFTTTHNLKRILRAQIQKHDVLYMTAAVSDYRPQKLHKQKIKKSGKKELLLKLIPNPDILVSLKAFKKKRIYIGFSVESSDILKNAQRKLTQKSLDLLVAQKVGGKHEPFGQVPVDAWLLRKDGSREYFKGISKRKLALYLIREVSDLV